MNIENYFSLETKNWILLNGDIINNKETFLKEISKLLNFPGYFGKNWDALNDCITDMSWFDLSKPLHIIYKNSNNFQENSPNDFSIAMEIMSSAVKIMNKNDLQMVFTLL